MQHSKQPARAATARRVTLLAVASVAGPTMPMWAVYPIIICVGLALAVLAGGGAS